MAMHFLHVTLHRADRPSGGFDGARARVAVSALDLFSALERTIDALRDSGWTVDDLDQFSIDVNPQFQDASPEVQELCREAKASNGIAWRIEEWTPEFADGLQERAP